MSKRSEQTTGMPKPAASKSNQTAEQANQTRGSRLLGQYRTRHEREAAVQRLIILGTAAIGGLAIILVLVALLIDQLIVPNQAVASVNGENISVAAFERRVRLERTLANEQITQGYLQAINLGFSPEQAQQQLLQIPFFSNLVNEMQVPDQLGNRVLNDMIDDTLVRQQAEALGVTIDQDRLQEQIQQFFGYDPNAGLFTPTPSPTATSSPTPFITATPSPVPTNTPTPEPTATAEFTATPSVTPQATATASATPDAATREAQFNTTRQSFYSYINSTGRLGDGDLNAYFESIALRQAVRDALTADLPRTATYVDVRHILVATEDEARDILAALEAGESFSELAAAASTDTSNASTGGELGWSPLTRYVAEFADAARDAEIGTFVGPVQTEFGYHILQVRGREERALSDDDYEQAKDRAFTDWLENLREEQSASIQTFDAWVENVPTDPALQIRAPQ
jgi:hypothetical protein